VNVPDLPTNARLVCRACKSFATFRQFKSSLPMTLFYRLGDDVGNTQPENPVWNYRGLMNNAWFRTVIAGFEDAIGKI